MSNDRTPGLDFPPLEPAPLPQRGDRVLVVAPHPDDESLGTGGLICAAVRRGAEVRVAYLTSGDGFPLAAAAQFRRWPNRSVLRRLAEVRRGEAVRALRHLGVGEDATHFLDYPDRRLAPLWLSDGETRISSGKLRPGGSREVADGGLSRASLLIGLDRLLDEARPDYLLFPDPADDHPDHWAAYCFMRLVLGSRRLRGRPVPHTCRTYLIHRGCWPRPLQERPDLVLTPPPELRGLGVRWESAPLAREDLEAKRRALAEHRTQQRLVGSFFRGFVRGTELLSDWEGAGTLDTQNRVRLPDPVADRFGRAWWGGADVAELEVCVEGAERTLIVHLREPARAGLEYRVFWTPVTLDPAASSVRTTRHRAGRAGSETVAGELTGYGLRVTLPPELSAAPLLIAAEVWLGAVLLDRTPWRFVDSYQSPPNSTC